MLLTNKYFYEAEQLSLLFPDSVLPITFIMKATLSDNKDSVVPNNLNMKTRRPTVLYIAFIKETVNGLLLPKTMWYLVFIQEENV